MNLIAGLAVFVVVSQPHAEAAHVQVKQKPEELKKALVGKWVSDDADKIPVEFGADGSFKLAVSKSIGSGYTGGWRWETVEGTYVVSDDGKVQYQAKLGGLAVKGQFTMKDGALIHPTGANYQTRWKKVPKGSDPPVAPERDPDEAFSKAHGSQDKRKYRSYDYTEAEHKFRLVVPDDLARTD